MTQKKTIRTTVIDGKKIIIGTDRANISAPETNNIVAVELLKTAEYAEAEKYRISVEKYRDLATDAYKNWNATPAGALSKPDLWDQYIMRRTQHQDELKVLANRISLLNAKRRDLMIQFAVYHATKPDDYIVEDSVIADYEAKNAALTKNQVLEFDGISTITTIPNYKGMEWFLYSTTWTYGFIDAIGTDLPAGAKTRDMLTDAEIAEIEAQKETERIAALDTTAKEIEKQEKISILLAVATNMRFELEVQGDPDAVTKARDYYVAELAVIEATYA